MTLQKEAKENLGSHVEPESKLQSVSSSAANSDLGSPRLTLSPRLPSTNSFNSALSRRESTEEACKSSLGKTLSPRSKWRQRIHQPLDVSQYLPHSPDQDADQCEPTSPTGSVASVTSTSKSSIGKTLSPRSKWRLRLHPPLGLCEPSLDRTTDHNPDDCVWPTSPTGSVASFTSIASETALFRRRTGMLSIPCNHDCVACNHSFFSEGCALM